MMDLSTAASALRQLADRFEREAQPLDDLDQRRARLLLRFDEAGPEGLTSREAADLCHDVGWDHKTPCGWSSHGYLARRPRTAMRYVRPGTESVAVAEVTEPLDPPVAGADTP